MSPNEQKARRILAGAYDLHMHAAPSPFHRALDDYGLLAEAAGAGMAGIILKSHYESTAARAALVNAHAGVSAIAYGGIVLNWPVGGLNPYAAVNALKRGARVIWMPTRDAQNSLHAGNMPGDFFRRPGISILDDTGTMRPEVLEILDLARQYNAAVATGHISPAESGLLCREGRRRGTRMILTHPEFDRTRIGVQAQKELAGLGVYIERCWYNIAERNCSAQEMAEHIRAVGAAHCFLSSDRGQAGREHPVEGMRQFLISLLECGISEEDLYQMTHENPAQVLGLA